MTTSGSQIRERFDRPRVFGFVMALVTLFGTMPIALLWGEPEAPPIQLLAALAAGMWWIPSFWAALQVSRGVRPGAVFVVIVGWVLIGSLVWVATGMPFALLAWIAVAALVATSYWLVGHRA
jgi:hypothetical protein